MTHKARLAAKMSEKRERVNALLSQDEMTEEQRGELAGLTKELQDLEIELRAAITEEQTRETRTEGSPEERELRELRGRVRVGNYLGAALEMRAADGAEAEFNQAHGMGLDRFPLELLAPEIRATTATESAVMQQSWLDRLFTDTAMVRLGISMRSVSPGMASYPVTTAGASAAQRAKEQAIGDTAWTVGVTEMKPKRNGVRAVFVMEDAARLPGLEEALRRDLSMALTEGIDRAVFLGDAGATGTDADIVGLNTAGITETTLTQANKIKGPETLTAFSNLVDGIHAGGYGDLGVVAAIGAWRLWENTVANAAAENQTMAQFLRMAGLSWSSRGNLEDATAAGDFAAYIGRARGIDGAGIAAVWESAQLIRDPYSGAAKGEIALTLNYLWDFALPRTANFSRIKFVA